MRAMVFEKPGQRLRQVEWPMPEPGSGQVQVRVAACAACRTDLHVVDGELTEPKLPLVRRQRGFDTCSAGPSSSIRDWCKRWLETKEVENEASTHSRYELAIRSFVDFLGTKADRDLDHLSANDVLRYRDTCAKQVSVASTNTNLRVVRACMNASFRQGLVERNVAAQVSALRERGESKRRALTMEEVRRVLEECGDSAWRGLVLVGLYTGQRLADCARLTWQQVDLMKQTIWFVTQKTGKRQINEVTFHSLRHTFTTWLKATGASNALAQLIVGHDSPLVSSRYTHLSAEDTTAPIGNLPDVTANGSSAA